MQQGFIADPNQLAVVQKPQVTVVKPIVTPPPPRPVPVVITTTTPKPTNTFDLIGSIIKQLTPHIKDSVSSSLGGNKGTPTNFDKPKPAIIRPPLRVTIPKPKPVRVIDPIPTRSPVNQPIVLDFENKFPGKNENDDDLVKRIISQLTPHIKQSVTKSLDGKNTPSLL